MKLRELLNGIEILETNADPDMEIADLRYDSRRIEAGDLFVAIRGYEADGHGFIGAAAERGAAAILCEECVPGVPVPFIRVKSTRKALALASRSLFGAPGDRMTLIGVTGTNGKTTSTVLIKHVLEKARGARVGPHRHQPEHDR